MTAPDPALQLLAALDARLVAGEITQHEYAAQRALILELAWGRRTEPPVAVRPANLGRVLGIGCLVLVVLLILILGGCAAFITLQPLR